MDDIETQAAELYYKEFGVDTVLSWAHLPDRVKDTYLEEIRKKRPSVSCSISDGVDLYINGEDYLCIGTYDNAIIIGPATQITINHITYALERLKVHILP